MERVDENPAKADCQPIEMTTTIPVIEANRWVKKRKRSIYDIYADILKMCLIPRLKTHIVYGCNLNFQIIKRYIHELQDLDYLRYEGDHYETTENGDEWTKRFDALERLR